MCAFEKLSLLKYLIQNRGKTAEIFLLKLEKNEAIRCRKTIKKKTTNLKARLQEKKEIIKKWKRESERRTKNRKKDERESVK